MTTQFVTVEIPLSESMAMVQSAIAQALAHYGEPLRWAITSIDRDRQIAHLEAVVTCSARDGVV